MGRAIRATILLAEFLLMRWVARCRNERQRTRARHWAERKRLCEHDEQRRRDAVIAKFGTDLNAMAAELLRYRHAVAQLADAIGWVRTGAPFFAIGPREQMERTTSDD